MGPRLVRNKTTPRVRDGRVQKKNCWAESVDGEESLLGSTGITFEMRAPGPTERHVVSEIDVRRFLRCIPDWEKHAEGLRAIVLGGRDAMGRYDHRGIIYLCPWSDDLFWDCELDFFEEHRETLHRIGVPHDATPVVDPALPGDKGTIPLYFDERSARAFQLVHVFLHELGHHRDRMTRRSHYGRGEEFAEAWALEMEPLVWPRYKEFFGVPGKVRIDARPRNPA
jgi:hypothetical protein